MATPVSSPTPSEAGLPHHREGAAVATGTIIGAAAGAAAGAIAGPPGMLAGAVLGAFAGGATGEALAENEAVEAKHDADLDEEIGVAGGEMGAAMTTRPSRIGCFSASSAGAGESRSPSQDGGTGLVGAGESGD